MSPGTGPAFQQAMNKLMTQVNKENVLAAAAVFQHHADRIDEYLAGTEGPHEFGACGGDPVSADTLGPASFHGKIQELHRIHSDHALELRTVAGHLFETARQYGYTDDQIEQIMTSNFAKW